MSKAAKVVSGLLVIFMTLPIWFFLQYKILVMVNATELMWFLFWVYVPFTILAAVLMRLGEE